jgi:hypothetical protein
LHKSAKRWQILLARGEHRLDVVGDGDMPWAWAAERSVNELAA